MSLSNAAASDEVLALEESVIIPVVERKAISAETVERLVEARKASREAELQFEKRMINAGEGAMERLAGLKIFDNTEHGNATPVRVAAERAGIPVGLVGTGDATEVKNEPDPTYICCRLSSWPCQDCGTPMYMVYLGKYGISDERHEICGSGKHKKCTMDLGPSKVRDMMRASRDYTPGECKHAFCKAPVSLSMINNPAKDGKTYAQMKALPFRQQPSTPMLYAVKQYELVQKHGIACNMKALQDAAKEETKRSPEQCYACGIVHAITPWDYVGKVVVVLDNGTGASQLAKVDRIDHWPGDSATVYLVYANQSGRMSSYISRQQCEIEPATPEQTLVYERERAVHFPSRPVV